MTAAALAFDEAKHHRGARGRFTSGATAKIVRPQARSQTPGEAWQRIGAKLPKLPIAYTGSRDRELPVGSFTHHKLQGQIPRTMSVKDHQELVHSLISVVAGERAGTTQKGQERGLIPPGTEKRSILRAYNHAAMHSLHSFGTHDYDFKMDDHLKAELTPLVPFMRYAHRRIKDTMLAKHKGKWRPYREEFGQPFKDERTDKFTGAIRKRVRPNQELIKMAGATHPGAYAALPAAIRHLVPAPGAAEMAAIEHDSSLPKHVRAIMPMTRNILSSVSWAKSPGQALAARRHARSKLVADHRVPLTRALAKRWAAEHFAE